jgi:hypothetical protein
MEMKGVSVTYFEFTLLRQLPVKERIVVLLDTYFDLYLLRCVF